MPYSNQPHLFDEGKPEDNNPKQIDKEFIWIGIVMALSIIALIVVLNWR